MRSKFDSVVLITGASSGIGRACALQLARLGASVYGTTRRAPEDCTDELRRGLPSSARLEVLTMNVNEDSSVLQGIEKILDREGRIDGLVNCAGFGIAGPIEETSDEEAKAILETNLFGTLRVCRAVLPAMRRQGFGTIINVSSIGGRIALPFQGLYSASKYGIEGLSESLRMEVHPFGVRVVLVEPGDFCTGFTDSRQTIRAATPSSPYASSFRAALSVAESDERKGTAPESIGHLVARILAKRSPRLRYTIGPTAQRLALRLKSILPSRTFEWALRAYYRVK
jgi:NAD(P)-dependent dehydrogenase (short-subunit alcohol dehydrogenase family)